MWVCVSELSASLCVLQRAFSSPPFSASISLWILSMGFWNHEHRALLFVSPHQNGARVTEGSPDLGTSALPWLLRPCGSQQQPVDELWGGLGPPAHPREMGSAGSLAFPCFFRSFLSPRWDAQGWLYLGVDPPGVLVSGEECRDSLSHHQGISSQDFQLLSPIIPSP